MTVYNTDLLTKIERPPHTVSTPEVTQIGHDEENEYQSIITLQKLLKGRAIHGFVSKTIPISLT